MKIGILGGTFNPVHIGHLILAEEISEKLGLDKLIFVPAYLPPHKGTGDIISAAERLKMVRLAIEGNRGFAVSDIEIRRRGPSYTIDTVRALKKKFPQHTFFFITGSDLLNYLKEWKDLKDVIRLVTFIVATRPGYPLAKIPSYIRTVSIRAVDISAFEIRRCIKDGRSFRYLVPDVVYRYIRAKRLYY
jgi:nicotinate-nucleotide adenylyltransferase